MAAVDLNVFAEQMLRDASFGLGFLAILMVVNTFVFMQIFFWFLRGSQKDANQAPWRLLLRFIAAVLLMCTTQIGSIFFWAATVHLTGLIENIRTAMLFAGSCYTTLGIYSDGLTSGWQSLAFYIAFSGLFSFAIATSAMIAMLTVIAKRVYMEGTDSHR